MYAVSDSSDLNHLLYPETDYTLCGFRAEKLAAPWSHRLPLHVVATVPPNRELCKQCDKMDKRRKQAQQG